MKYFRKNNESLVSVSANIFKPNMSWYELQEKNLSIEATDRKGRGRLRAVSLFSVVCRAKGETRKWPRAWLMTWDGRGFSRAAELRFARLAASPLPRACIALTNNRTWNQKKLLKRSSLSWYKNVYHKRQGPFSEQNLEFKSIGWNNCGMYMFVLFFRTLKVFCWLFEFSLITIMSTGKVQKTNSQHLFSVFVNISNVCHWKKYYICS